MWVTADDIKQWLAADDLVADSVKVIRNHETQESKGFAFVEAPTQDEMQAIIRRFDRAPLEDKLLRANPAQPSKGKVSSPPTTQAAAPVREHRPSSRPSGNGGGNGSGNGGSNGGANGGGSASSKPKRRERDHHEPKSAFATELANSLAK